MSGRIILNITTSSGQTKDITFDQHDTFLFGRLPDCHICLPHDEKVSRHHFILEINPPDARIRDLGSLNGTYVNGIKYGGRQRHETPEEGAKRHYPEVDLQHGDQIVVGDTILRFSVEVTSRQSAVVLCQRCGKDVSAEVGAARHGDYVCQDCRNKLQNDPLALLMALLQQARQQQAQQAELNIPDYDIERKLGEGGMGAVYLARHKKRGFYAALKVMLSRVAVDEKARALFMREVETTRALRHKNIVEFFEHGSSGSVFYFLLEFCEGGSVADLMAHRGHTLSLNEAVPVILQTLEGLAYAHSKGFVHRDMKPHNILLSGKEGRWAAKVADMGLSKNFTRAGFSGLTATGRVAGSFAFMPREQLTDFKRSTPVSDVWAVGATFYNIVTGQLPRDCRPGQDPIDMVLNNPVIPIRQREARIPPRIAEVIDRSLTNVVQDRYQNAGEMLKALASAL